MKTGASKSPGWRETETVHLNIIPINASRSLIACVYPLVLYWMASNKPVPRFFFPLIQLFQNNLQMCVKRIMWFAHNIQTYKDGEKEKKENREKEHGRRTYSYHGKRGLKPIIRENNVFASCDCCYWDVLCHCSCNDSCQTMFAFVVNKKKKKKKTKMLCIYIVKFCGELASAQCTLHTGKRH